MLKQGIAQRGGRVDNGMGEALNALDLEKPLATVKIDNKTVSVTMSAATAIVLPMMMMVAF